MTKSQLPVITLVCPDDHSFTTRAAGGGTVRCKTCKKPKRVPMDRPRTARDAAAYQPAANDHQDQDPALELATRWEAEPPWTGRVQLRDGRDEDTCPDHGPLLWEPGRTLVFCHPCARIALPDSIGQHYDRKESQLAEVAVLETEPGKSDEEQKNLYASKRLLRDQLAAILTDDKLSSEAHGILEWYAEAVSKAGTQARLDNLVEQFKADRGKIRPRHWWQGQSATFSAFGEDQQEEDWDEDQDQEQPYALPAASVLATPVSIAEQQHRAQPKRMDWAGGLRAAGWRLSAVVGGCQIINERSQLCGAETMHHIGNGWICDLHYATLAGLITDYNRTIA
jgi:hypothetical protein